MSKHDLELVCDEIAYSYDFTCKSRYEIEKHNAKKRLEQEMIYEVTMDEKSCMDYLEKYNMLLRHEIESWDDENMLPDPNELSLVIDHAVYYLSKRIF